MYLVFGGCGARRSCVVTFPFGLAACWPIDAQKGAIEWPKAYED